MKPFKFSKKNREYTKWGKNVKEVRVIQESKPAPGKAAPSPADIDCDGVREIYANMAAIAHTETEFVFDFIFVQPGLPKARVGTRIIANPLQAGRLRGLAVSTGTRTAALPEVPTLAEAGVNNIAVAGWHGLVAPRGTEPAVVARLNQAVGEVLRNRELRERLAALGIEPMDEPPEALAAKLRADAARWAPLIQRTGMQPD